MRLIKIPNFKRIKVEGGAMPWGWGCAYFDHIKREIIIMPLPFNIIFSHLRNAYWWMVNIACATWFDDKVNEMFQERQEHLKQQVVRNRGFVVDMKISDELKEACTPKHTCKTWDSIESDVKERIKENAS